MGPGETIAMLGLCALGVAIVALIFASYSRRLAFKQRKLELDAQVRMGSGAVPAAVAKLEDRVRVLERIATDRGHDVAHQIEALRDVRRSDALMDAREPETT